MVNSSPRRGVSLVRLVAALIVLGGIGWCLFTLPLPCSVYCGVVVEPIDPARIYATYPGRLEFVAPNYGTVAAGQIVARIENSSLQRTRQLKQKELQIYEDRIRELQLRFNEEASLAAVIDTAKQKLQTLQDELKLLDQEIRGLTIKSPLAGIVYPNPARPRRWIDEPTTQSWEGYLNDPKNTGCVVSRGEHLFSVCGGDQIGVSLIVGESEVELVEIGQRVTIRFEQLPGQLLVGEVTEIQKQDLPLDRDASQNFPMESYLDRQGKQQLLQTPFRVEVGNIELPPQVFPGSTGRGKISVRKQTLAHRFGRVIRSSLSKQGAQ